MARIADKQIAFPIIDSHIHLYAKSHLQDLAWTGTLPTCHVLNRQNSIAEYRQVTRSQPNLIGFVFVETDRKSNLSEDAWTHALEEIDFLKRIKAGTPREGEGHVPDDKSLLLGAVAWAPMPGDQVALHKYLERAACTPQSPSGKGHLIKGFRYLLQDKAAGTQLDPNFIQNLITLEKQGFKTFDLGIDFHRRGTEQLDESIRMLNTFYASSNKSLSIVINHLCKPNLLPDDQQASSTISTNFEFWVVCIRQLAAFPTTYMKLSGLFSEMPVQDPEHPTLIFELLERVRPYVQTIFECFGPDRIMFGSDWPVCNVDGPGPEKSWQTWVDLVAAILEELKLSRVQKAAVWAGTANRVYGLGIDLSEVKD